MTLREVFDIEQIREGKPHFGRFDLEALNTDWQVMLSLFDTHPAEKITKNSEKFRVNMRALHQRESCPGFAQLILRQMNELFPRNVNSLIAFMGFGLSSESYPPHRDPMDVFLVQVIGDIDIEVEGLGKQTMKPTDTVWLPRGTEHHIQTEGSRVTFSFGVENDPNPIEYI